MDEPISVTQTTYRVSDFLSWQRQGNLDLRPPFQRGNVWTPKAKSFFIDSIVRGFPVPLIFLQDKTDPKTFEPKRLVVDGQQRLRTVLAFIDAKCLGDLEEADRFSVLQLHNAEIANLGFRQLPQPIQERILQFQFSVHVMSSTTPNRLLLETFARMNATGTRLSEQEIRNAEFTGSFKQVSYELAYEELERWIAWHVFSKQQIARMREVELTSELLMFLINGFSGKSQPAIRKAYRDWDDGVPHEQAVRRRFGQVLAVLDDVYSDGLNRMFGEQFSESPFRSQNWFYPLYALTHDLCFSTPLNKKPSERAKELDALKLRRHLQKRAEALESDEVDEKLTKALRGASTDKSSRQSRYEFLRRGWRIAGS
jgi:hypothetical protein